MPVLVTGAAGFIGYHLSKKLLANGFPVIGIDNLNSYYDPSLKQARLANLHTSARDPGSASFYFENCSLEDSTSIANVFNRYNPTYVVNLAAQAGVRYSIENPSAYIQANLVGFTNVLDCCRDRNVDHFIYASSSSVYGGNTSMPFKETDSVDHPVSLYAATKKSNELIAHSYSHLYNLPATGLRFFTVYGPWGRPDMALFLFAKAIIQGKPIDVFNNGQMIRDFTYIDDIIESLFRLLTKPAQPDPLFSQSNPNPSTSWAPHRVFNIGNSNPTPLMSYIDELEKALGISSIKNFLPMQPGDVPATSADTSALAQWIDFSPNTPIDVGIPLFVDWYRKYYRV